MGSRCRSRLFLTNSFLFLLLVRCASVAQWVTEEINLQPGWNAIFVNVEPCPEECDDIFAGTPVESVWKWNRRFVPQQFEVDPNELVPEDPHWRVWLPADHPQSFLRRLFALGAGNAYLVKVATNASPFVLQLKGRVVVPAIEWYPHTINLVGTAASPEGGPTFNDYFAYTPEIDTTRGYYNEIYRIDPSGRIRRIVAAGRDRVEAGRAYWIRCAARPAAAAPVEVPAGSELDFGEVGIESDLEILNPSTERAITVTVKQVSSEDPPASGGFPERGGDVPLSYLVFNAQSNRWEWETLSVGEVLTNVLAPGGQWLIRFGVRRSDFPPYNPSGTNGYTYQSILEVRALDGQVLQRVPVSAAPGQMLLGASQPQDPHKGLWVGDVRLTQVNCPAYSGTNLLPTTSACEFRLIVHVDAAGQARLLQEVLMAWTPTSGTNGEYRLYRHPSELPPDARDVSRIASVAFPFMDPVPLTGSFTGTLSGTVTVDCNDPVNPFLHRYNPLLDNRDWEYVMYTNPVETRTVTRFIRLEFSDNVQTNSGGHPIWGVHAAGGTYQEVLRGLRVQDIVVEGSFSLQRISLLDELY